MSSSTLSKDIAAYLQSEHLPPTAAWLTSFLQCVDQNRALAPLKSTARFRILASDITESIQSSPANSFPPDMSNGTINERKIRGPVLVQVLNIEDIGRSRWSQVEAIESAERGETTKGREVIRVVPSEETSEQNASNLASNTGQLASQGPHKLVLQDANGQQAYGFELTSVEGLSVNINIGAKLTLRDATVARGAVLLEPKTVHILGGKVERLHKAWKDGRKERLKTIAGMVDENG